MKLLAILILAASLTGCETTTNDDGTRTTRFDAKAATEAVSMGYSAYDQYQRRAAIVGYDAYGNPIYRAQ